MASSILLPLLFFLMGFMENPSNAKEGLDREDPLSALLVVLAANLLQWVVNHAVVDGSLSHPPRS